MAVKTHSFPDSRRVVGSWVLTFVLTVLTLGSLAGKAEAGSGQVPVSAVESGRAA